jgi:hypothetical protein
VPGVQDIDIDIPIAPPRGSFTGQWRVVDGNTGEERRLRYQRTDCK